jgi:hypothetical protein
MKKIIIPIIMILLVFGVSAFDTSNYLLSDNPYITEPTFFENIFSTTFTIGVGTTKTVDVGDSFLIGVDETAIKSCSSASLGLTIRDSNNKIAQTGYLVKGQNVIVGTRLSKTFRFIVPSGFSEGTWTLKSSMLCGPTSETISKESTSSFQVGKKTTCVEGFVGNNFCDRTANMVLRPFRNCEGNVEIITNNEIDICSSNEICDDGRCNLKQTVEDDITSCGGRGGEVCSSNQECATEFYSDIDNCCKAQAGGGQCVTIQPPEDLVCCQEGFKDWQLKKPGDCPSYKRVAINTCDEIPPEEPPTPPQDDVGKRISLTRSEWLQASNDQILDSMCSLTSQCEQLEDFEVKCERSKAIEDRNQEAFNSQCKGTGIFRPFCSIGRRLSPEQSKDVLDGTCRAKTQGFNLDFIIVFFQELGTIGKAIIIIVGVLFLMGLIFNRK